MYSGQDANSGLQPVMQGQPIISGSGPIILAPTEKKTKRWPIVVAVILFLVAIGTGVAALVLTKSKPVVTDVAKAYIEYFVYGTEGENQVNEATFEMNSDDFAIKKKLESASSQESSEYFDKLVDKYNMLQNTGKEVYSADLLTYNKLYLDFYKAISQAMYSDFLINAFNGNNTTNNLYNNLAVGESALLKKVYDSLDKYTNERYKNYTKIQDWGCMNEGTVDYNCIWISDKEGDISWGDESMDEELYQYKGVIYNILVDNLNKFFGQGVVNE